jgi:hypothetical protein
LALAFCFSEEKKRKRMRASSRLFVKVKGNTSNMNQDSMKRMKLNDIRAQHLEKLAKAADEKPFGKADKHCIAAWMEIEAEDRAEMEKIGTPVPVIEKKLLENRSNWVAETTKAWEQAQPKIEKTEKT